ncbi:MAG: hypothetical protein ACLRSW_09525 [Christensenellaceae bacterium]
MVSWKQPTDKGSATDGTALNITLEDFFKEENRIEICKQEKELIPSYRKLSENAKRDLVQCAEIPEGEEKM